MRKKILKATLIVIVAFLVCEGFIVAISSYIGARNKEWGLNLTVSSVPEMEEDKVSDLLYRKFEFNIGRAYSREELSFHKSELELRANNPQKIIVVYNDQYLDEISVSEDIIRYTIKTPGWYGFYVEDEQGTLYDINEITYIFGDNIREESAYEKENE